MSIEKLECTDSKLQSLTKINAIADSVSFVKYDSTTTYAKDEFVTGIVEEELVICKSLLDENKGQDLTNTTYWEKISLGGGGGLEIGDMGIAPLGIDESQNKRRYINGQIIMQDQFVSFTNKLKKAVELYPSLVCTEAEWQATVTMSTFGQCGKFVIDDEAGTIRLPKITGFIQGLTDLASLGELVEAGLPTISHTHTRGTMEITGTFSGYTTGNTTECTGAFTSDNATTSGPTGVDNSGEGRNKTTFTASKNWTGATSTNSAVPAVYGKSSTVQPEAIRYPYFIQVATGAEESVDVTREIELNNPFFFGYYQYFEVAPNNISWLKSEGQWNSKAIYTDYYDWILTNANNGVENFKLSTDTYDDYCWVVNTTDETFRLPLKTKNAPFTVSGAKTTLSMGALSIKGNGKSLGLTDGTLTGGMTANNNYAAYGVFQKGAYNVNVGTAVTPGSTNDWTNNNKSIGVTTDASKSGLTGSVSGTATTTVSTTENTNVSLYFYVGETTQNANLINAGRIEEVVVNKINRTGDTMTGSLEVINGFYTRYIEFTNANNDNGGYIDFHFNGDKTVDFTSRIIEDNSGQISVIATNGFNFPKCTTKATTTSSASASKVAVVVQNYVSGTSWYRVWSDGWIEQGGRGTNTVKVNFLKNFSNTNYSVLLTAIGAVGYELQSPNENKTVSSFIPTNYQSQKYAIQWYACGY